MNQVLGSMKKTLLYAGMSPKDYRLICPDMRKENKRSLMAFSAITCVFLLVMFLLSFFSKDVADNRWVYFIILLAAGLIFFTAKSAPETEEGLMLAAIYTFVSLLFVFGIILGTVTRPDEQTVTFVALLLIIGWVGCIPQMLAYNAHRRAYNGVLSLISLMTLLAVFCDFANFMAYVPLLAVCASLHLGRIFSRGATKGGNIVATVIIVLFVLIFLCYPVRLMWL